MKLYASFLFAGGLLVSGVARAQHPAVQSEFELRMARLEPRGRLDTLQFAAPNDWAVQWTRVGAYQVAFSSNEVLSVFKGYASTIYHFNGGGWGVKPVLYVDRHLLVLATVDGYLTPRRYRLGEINLATGRYWPVAIGQQLGDVRYSADRTQVLFTKNGVARQWTRPLR